MRTIRQSMLMGLAVAAAVVTTSCHKEGTGGKASISGYVKHHTTPVPNCVVYIKYGATEFPGTDLTRYDDHVTADASAHYEIPNLYKGNYYLYGYGYDPGLGATVSGGVSIDIRHNKTYVLDVPVTE